ncbi:DUF6708 domain-containing protein [Cupriavidus taiwanensis]
MFWMNSGSCVIRSLLVWMAAAAVGQYLSIGRWCARRYMEDGPQSLPFPPLALTVSTETTLRNMVIIQVSGQFSGFFSILMLPITLPWAMFRYLAMKTCKRPIWPADVEAACAIEPNDPFVLEEPRYAGDAQTGGPAGDEQFLAYRERAMKMALEYDAERRTRLGPDGTAAQRDSSPESCYWMLAIWPWPI